MRATKEMFMAFVNELSNMVGQQLYLVQCYRMMYVTPVNDSNACDSNYLYCMSNAFTMENYHSLMAFVAGYAAALRRIQGN